MFYITHSLFVNINYRKLNFWSTYINVLEELCCSIFIWKLGTNLKTNIVKWNNSHNLFSLKRVVLQQSQEIKHLLACTDVPVWPYAAHTVHNFFLFLLVHLPNAAQHQRGHLSCSSPIDVERCQKFINIQRLQLLLLLDYGHHWY
jgi:hypothetical protein